MASSGEGEEGTGMERAIAAVAMSLFLATATFTPVASAGIVVGNTFGDYDGPAITGSDERLRSPHGPYHGKRSDERPGKMGVGEKEHGKEKGRNGRAGGGKQPGEEGDDGKGKAAENGKDDGKGPKKDNPGKAEGHGKARKAKGHGQGDGQPAACGTSTPAPEHVSPNAGGTPPGPAKRCETTRTNQTNATPLPRASTARSRPSSSACGRGGCWLTRRRPVATTVRSLRPRLESSGGPERVVRPLRRLRPRERPGGVRGRQGGRRGRRQARPQRDGPPDRRGREASVHGARGRRTLEDRNASFDEDAVERELSKAHGAVVRAEHVREQSPNPVAAVTHYRRAWRHAQRALDLMDAATTPRVTITKRSDPAHNDSINYTVRGTVYDVRPWLIENVTVSVNGEETTTPVFAGNATPGETWGFATHVALEGTVNRIEVTATDSSEVVAEGSEPFVPNEGRDVLRLDADRLPDRYEANRTTTGPLNPDSDDDGLTDGREVHWVTSADRTAPFETIRQDDVNRRGPSDFQSELRTDPHQKDTDGGGYWDGWIGVYDVGRTDNAVLYLDHLRDEDPGIQSDEIVWARVAIFAGRQASWHGLRAGDVRRRRRKG